MGRPVTTFLKFAAGWQGRILGTTLCATIDYQKADYNRPLILLMGNEQSGLTKLSNFKNK